MSLSHIQVSYPISKSRIPYPSPKSHILVPSPIFHIPVPYSSLISQSQSHIPDFPWKFASCPPMSTECLLDFCQISSGGHPLFKTGTSSKKKWSPFQETWSLCCLTCVNSNTYVQPTIKQLYRLLLQRKGLNVGLFVWWGGGSSGQGEGNSFGIQQS